MRGFLYGVGTVAGIVLGLLLAKAAYLLSFGPPPECLQPFKGGAFGSLQCGAGNPSFLPFAALGLGIGLALMLRWAGRFLRSLE